MLMTDDQYGGLLAFLGEKFGEVDARFAAIDARFAVVDRNILDLRGEVHQLRQDFGAGVERQIGRAHV